jgi:hypothetical protein
LESAVGHRELNQAFIDRLQARRTSTEKVYWRLVVAHYVLLLALFLNAFVLPADISIAGLSAKQVGAMKEIILFISATLAIHVGILFAEKVTLKSLALAWATKHYDHDVFPFASLLYEDLYGSLKSIAAPAVGHRSPAKALIALYILFLGLLLIWGISFLIATLVVYCVIVVDVATAPSLPPYWSTGIVVYAAIAYVASFLISLLLSLPLPYRDYVFARATHDLWRRWADALSSVTSITRATTDALNAKGISSNEATEVLKLLDEPRSLLDAADRLLQKFDLEAAKSRIDLADSGIKRTREYLSERGI